jgi:non-canonical purine NTP pyrophosphatase (RdgB/HAM1 family)
MKNNAIYFITSSAKKFAELEEWLAQLNPHIHLEQRNLDLPEIQSLDLREVAIAKAKDAWRKLEHPLLIDDAGLFLQKYPLFPGTLTKLIRPAIGIEGILCLAGSNRNASFRNCLVYIESLDTYYVFEGITHGTLIDPGDDKEKSVGSYDVFVPEGYDKVFAALLTSDQLPDFHYRYIAFKKFIDWYCSR